MQARRSVVGRDGTGGRPAGPVLPDPGSLAPPWAPAGAAVAVLITGILGGLVWHSTRLPGPDAWGLHLLGAHTERQFRLATELTTGLRALTVGGIVATALIAWMALRRYNAVALAVLAPAATLAVEKLLKPLVARQAEASPVFQYPSGHVAVATALALSLVLIVRSSRARAGVRTVAVLSSGLVVLLMAGARIVETAHVLSDVVGGAAAGVAVTLVAALILDQRRISHPQDPADRPGPLPFQRRRYRRIYW
jgi:membrane-associated phospholipid phosphatase